MVDLWKSALQLFATSKFSHLVDVVAVNAVSRLCCGREGNVMARWRLEDRKNVHQIHAKSLKYHKVTDQRYERELHVGFQKVLIFLLMFFVQVAW